MYKKNVALIIPSLRGGGAEKTVSRLSQQLSKRYNLYTIVFDNTDFKYEVKGKLIDLKLPYNQKITTKTYNFYKRFISLRRLKQKYKIGVSISFMEGPNLLNILSRVDDRVLISVRNYLSEDLSGPEAIYLPFIKPLYKRSDKIITVSHAVKYDLFKNFNIDLNQISTIYNFVDIKSIQKKCRQPINPLDEHIFKKDVIINMSRFTKQKGQIHLIKAFKYINQKKIDLNLVLLGEGPLYNSYQDLVKSLGLDKSIFFIPFKENPFPYLNRAKLYISSSLYEGLANAVLEAMACGLPIITSNCPGGIKEILKTNFKKINIEDDYKFAEYGIVTDGFYNKKDTDRSEKKLAKAVISLLDDKNLYDHYQKQSKLRIKNFSKQNILKDWIKIIG